MILFNGYIVTKDRLIKLKPRVKIVYTTNTSAFTLKSDYIKFMSLNKNRLHSGFLCLSVSGFVSLGRYYTKRYNYNIWINLK